MSEACSHNCSSCGSDCSERTAPQNSRNDNNKNVKKVIAVVSGKGGVGKTTTCANIGTGLACQGKKVVLIDTDIGLRNLDVVMGLESHL